jgi:hypothetical protein
MFYSTPFVRYSDPSFSQERTPSCQLRIQLSEQELAISVFDPVQSTFPLIERYVFQKGYTGLKPQEAFARILQTHSLTRLPFKEVECLIVSHVTTLVPGVLFDGAEVTNYLGLSHEVASNPVISWDRFSIQDIYLVYEWPLPWKQLLNSLFPEWTQHHYGYYLIRELLLINHSESTVYVHVQDYRMDVIVIRDRKLVFFNSFSFQSPEDFIYFVLLVYDRHDLNRNEHPLRLLGEIDRGSAIYEMCYRYIRDVGFTSRNTIQSVPKPIEETEPLPDHFLFNLLHSNYEDNQR